MNKPVYVGPFKKHLRDFIDLKQAIGYKYNTEEQHLVWFDRFICAKYPNAEILTKMIVQDWCNKRSHESQASQCCRASMIRQFATYLQTIDVQAYIIPKGYYPVEQQYVPYIYSLDELHAFFAETDKCHYCYECPSRHFIMPVFFRMIYQCGLRVTEARLLKAEDVDLHTGVLTINHSKKDKSRLVPMSTSLQLRCQEYSDQVHAGSTREDFFFPGLFGKPMTNTNVYHNFRRFLWRAGISHGGRGYGPRIYDFRHAFAVHRLKKWVEENKDLSACLPRLRTYMGHDSYEETAYYLRLTADVFPSLTLKLETKYAGIIPELSEDDFR